MVPCDPANRLPAVRTVVHVAVATATNLSVTKITDDLKLYKLVHGDRYYREILFHLQQELPGLRNLTMAEVPIFQSVEEIISFVLEILKNQDAVNYAIPNHGCYQQ